MYDVQDWAEARRLRAEGVSKAEIARRMGMSRTTVYELLGRDGPLEYERGPVPSLLDPFRDEVRAMLAESHWS